MKKIYLSWVFLFCCLYAQSISLRGLTTVTPGANYVYYLDLGNITKTTSYKVYCSTNGILTQYNDIQGTLTVRPGSMSTQTIILDWLKTGDAYIHVVQTDKPSVEAKLNIKVVTPPPASIKMVTEGNPRQDYPYTIKFVNTTSYPIESIVLPNGITEISHTKNYEEVQVRFAYSGTQTYIIKANHYEFTRTFNVIPSTIVGADAIAIDELQTFRVSDIPIGATCTWSVSNNLQIVSGQGTASVVVKAIGTGNAHINASILGENILKNIAAGVPDANKIEVTIGSNNTLYAHFTNRNECRARYTGNGTILEYSWEASGWEIFNPLAANYSVVFLKNILEPSSPSSPTTIKIQARNSAGWSSAILVGANVNTSFSGSYKIQATKKGVINVIENKQPDDSLIKNDILSSTTPLHYEICNSYTGILIQKGNLNKNGGTLDVSNLPNGLYIFTLIIDSHEKLTEKIMIRH